MQRITKTPEVRRQEILDTAIRLFYEKLQKERELTANTPPVREAGPDVSLLKIL